MGSASSVTLYTDASYRRRIAEVDRAASLRVGGNNPGRPPVDRWDDDRVYGEPSPC